MADPQLQAHLNALATANPFGHPNDGPLLAVRFMQSMAFHADNARMQHRRPFVPGLHVVAYMYDIQQAEQHVDVTEQGVICMTLAHEDVLGQTSLFTQRAANNRRIVATSRLLQRKIRDLARRPLYCTGPYVRH